MGLARFVARDPRAPGLTLDELEKISLENGWGRGLGPERKWGSGY